MIVFVLYLIAFESTLMIITDLVNDPNNLIDAAVGLILILTGIWQGRKWFNEQRTKGYCALMTRIVTNETMIEGLKTDMHEFNVSQARIEGILKAVLRRDRNQDDFNL